jgi:hypothetical protein
MGFDGKVYSLAQRFTKGGYDDRMVCAVFLQKYTGRREIKISSAFCDKKFIRLAEIVSIQIG